MSSTLEDQSVKLPVAVDWLARVIGYTIGTILAIGLMGGGIFGPIWIIDSINNRHSQMEQQLSSYYGVPISVPNSIFGDAYLTITVNGCDHQFWPYDTDAGARLSLGKWNTDFGIQSYNVFSGTVITKEEFAADLAVCPSQTAP